jgi:hypothetical protein
MRTSFAMAILGAGVGALACGPAVKPAASTSAPATAAAPQPTPEPPPVPRTIVVTIESATIDAAKPDGAAWDDKTSKGDKEKLKSWLPQPGSPLHGYVRQHPELDGAEIYIGQPVEMPSVIDGAAESASADPMVLVQAGDRVFRSPLRAGQFHPVWQFPLLVTVMPTDELRITIVDWDGPSAYDVLGETTVTGAILTSGKPIDLPRFGSVERLAIRVADAPAGVTHRVAVPGRPTWTETGIPVIAGQEVTILATGRVCSKGDDKAYCAGPEGQVNPSESSNVKGFEKRGHGVLVGAVGDVRFVVGRERRFVAPSSGPLLLGVNDTDANNNKGEFEAAVTLR